MVLDRKDIVGVVWRFVRFVGFGVVVFFVLLITLVYMMATLSMLFQRMGAIW